MPIEMFSEADMSYTIVFNSALGQSSRKSKKKNKQGADGEDPADGPVVDRRCPRCGHERMSYAAIQLRSADEGQTVFFTCLKCKFKENENS